MIAPAGAAPPKERPGGTIFATLRVCLRPQPRSVRELLDLYGVTGAEKEGLIQLSREVRQPGWWHSFRDVLPNPYEVYISLEADASSLRVFEPLVIPGQLQTVDYARALIRGGPLELDPDEIERFVEVRMTRQAALERPDRSRLWVVLDEAAIRRVVGGPAVMREQLTHLIQSAEQGRTTIQVIPFEAGAHAGVTGPFVILNFPQPSDPDVVYMETIGDGLYLDASRDVGQFILAFERLLAAALHPDRSLDLIQRAANALSTS